MNNKEYDELAKQIREQTGIPINFVVINDLKFFEENYEFYKKNGKFCISIDDDTADLTKQQYLEVIDSMIYMLNEIKVALRNFVPSPEEDEEESDEEDEEEDVGNKAELLINKLNLITKYSKGKLLVSNLGGGFNGFRIINEKIGKEIIFGYANDVLGYEIDDLETRKMIDYAVLGTLDSTAKEEYDLILQTLTKHGF